MITGRELVNTEVLAKSMWCNYCKIPLSFNQAVDKLQKGLSNIYSIECINCHKPKAIRTDTTFGEKNQFVTCNAKLAMGNYNSSCFLSSLFYFMKFSKYIIHV